MAYCSTLTTSKWSAAWMDRAICARFSSSCAGGANDLFLRCSSAPCSFLSAPSLYLSENEESSWSLFSLFSLSFLSSLSALSSLSSLSFLSSPVFSLRRSSLPSSRSSLSAYCYPCPLYSLLEPFSLGRSSFPPEAVIAGARCCSSLIFSPSLATVSLTLRSVLSPIAALASYTNLASSRLLSR